MINAFDKDIIRRSFSRAAPTYNAHSSLQAEVAREVVTCLKRNLDIDAVTRDTGDLNFLDVGCGTGRVAEALNISFPDSSVCGIDLSPSMIEVARRNYPELNFPKLNFLEADFESLPFPDKSFTTIISSLTYQWATDLSKAFSEASRVLKEGGLFAFSTLGPDTMKELRSSTVRAQELLRRNGLPPFMEYRALPEIQERLLQAGFKILYKEQQKVIRKYKDLWDLLRTLKLIGAENPHPGGHNTLARGTLARGTLLKETSRIYNAEFGGSDGCVPATYDVIYFVCEKERS